MAPLHFLTAITYRGEISLILISQISKRISIGNFGNGSKVVRISPLVAACTLEAILVTGGSSFFIAVEEYRGRFGENYRISIGSWMS